MALSDNAESAAFSLDPANPLGSARAFVELHHTENTENGARTLHHHRGTFHRWTGTHYEELRDEELKAALYRFLDKAGGDKQFNPNKAKVANVLDAIKAVTELPHTLQPPQWLDGGSHPPEELMACRNGLVHLPSGRLLPHDPQFFNSYALDYDYVPDAPEPRRWLEFLVEVFGDDQESIDTLQEWFGLLLTSDTRYQKMLLLIGGPRSGKGTIGRIMTALIGDRNVCAPDLHALGDRFTLQPMIGKQLAIIPDLRLTSSRDGNRIVERLLSMSGEDTLTIDRKHITAWSGRLSTRIVIMSNEVPRLPDASGVIATRFIALKFKRSFLGSEDVQLERKLLDELPGILKWSLDGLGWLRHRGCFAQPGSANDLISSLALSASPIRRFVEERCVIGPGWTVRCDQLRVAWCDWCDSKGIDPSASAFGHKLRQAVDVESIRPRDGDERKRRYKGIALRQ